MPELPEVEASRQFLRRHILNQVITSVTLTESGKGPRDGLFDDIVFEGASMDTFRKALLALRVLSVCRKGKQLWWTFGDRRPAVLFHFGMTGAFVVKGRALPGYKSFKVSDTWPPKFAKCLMTFDNGEELAFTDPRRLGRVRLRKDPIHTEPIANLAPDPIEDGIDLKDFAERLGKSSAPIKAVLLDQNKLVSGIGNWVADEVLHQSGIDPTMRSDALPSSSVARLRDTILSVLRTAVSCTTATPPKAFPKDWMFHVRWGKGKGKTAAKLPDGRAIEFKTVGGRTTAIAVPSTQNIVQDSTKKVVTKKARNDVDTTSDVSKRKKRKTVL